MKRHLSTHNAFLLQGFPGTCCRQEDAQGDTTVPLTSTQNILGKVRRAEQQPPSPLVHRVQSAACNI